jgi:hypothetical protein
MKGNKKVFMNITELREELEKITSGSDVSSHKRKIETLCKDFGCSIRVSDEYDPTKREKFHCFEYALDPYRSVQEPIRIGAEEFVRFNSNENDPDEIFWCQFLEYLVEKGYMREKEESVLANNDLVIYFRNSKPKHAGLWKNGRVTSKWGSKGLLYNHEIFELPVSYGTPKYFSGIQPALHKKLFLEYARGKGIPEDILSD